MFEIPAFGFLREENGHDFESGLNHISRLSQFLKMIIKAKETMDLQVFHRTPSTLL